MPYASEGEGLHLPPVPEALNRACPDIKYPAKLYQGAGPYFSEQNLKSSDRWPIQAVFWLEWGSSIAGRIPLWFAEQKMNMLRHDYVPVNLKSEAAPHAL